MILLALALQPNVPDNRLLVLVSVVVVTSVVLFTGAVIVTLLRRSDRRRAEEEKLAAMGTATARILHQIKNPLQTIVLHADILRDDRMVAQPEQRREVSDAIVSESQRLVAMLDELSVYASGEQRALNRVPVALHDLVRQVVRHDAREAEGTELVVDLRCVAPAVVHADAYYLRQALENLVRNAREAMEGRPGSLLVVSVERDGPQAAVRVADNGPGIPPEKLRRIFEPFVSTKTKGMGLGLAICREIVESHHGRLDVDSAEGRGTTFTMRLPAAAAAPAPAPPSEPARG
jgi:signal transduction histidine kinase